MKLVAKCTITNGKKTYRKGDIFETDDQFTEKLVPKSASYLEPIEVIEEGQEDKVVETIEIPENLETLTVAELKDLCKKLEIDVAGKNKAQLIEAIELETFDDEDGNNGEDSNNGEGEK